MCSLIHPHNQGKFEDNKGVIRCHKSKNDRQYNVQIKRTKGQTTIYKTGKTKHRATPIPLSTGVDLCCFG
jgi:hypothetical protein